MAMVCVTGGRECDGCSRCFRDDPVYTCPVCGTELDPHDKVYKTDRWRGQDPLLHRLAEL